MNEGVAGGGEKRLPWPFERHDAGQEKYADPGQGSKDWDVVQKERERSPQDRIAEAAGPHSQPCNDADEEVHQRDGDQVTSNLVLDLARDVDRLPLVRKRGKDFDKSAQESVAGCEQEEEDHHRGEQSAHDSKSAESELAGDL